MTTIEFVESITVSAETAQEAAELIEFKKLRVSDTMASKFEQRLSKTKVPPQ